MYQALAFILALVAAVPAMAQTVRVKVDGASLTLMLPAGHCPLERKNPSDRKVIQAVERLSAKTNRVLILFADCVERAAFRAGTQATLDNFGQYMTPRKGVRTKLAPAAFAQQMTEELKSQGAEVLRGAEADTRERIGTLKLNIRMGETRVLGVLRTDDRAAYLGIVLAGTTDTGASKLTAGVTAFGVVKGRVVLLNLYSRFTEGPIGAETVVKLLDKSTQTFAATAEANRP
jgi:hypothetical protein